MPTSWSVYQHYTCNCDLHGCYCILPGTVKMAVSETRRKPVGNFRGVPHILGPVRTPRRKPIGNPSEDLHDPMYICDCSHFCPYVSILSSDHANWPGRLIELLQPSVDLPSFPCPISRFTWGGHVDIFFSYGCEKQVRLVFQIPWCYEG